MSNHIPYGRQHINQEDINAIVEAVQADRLTQGPKVEEFENLFAEYVGARYAVAVTNGTAALHIAVAAAGIEPGQKVITTPITFAASANCVLYCGGEPVFAEIDPKTALICPESVKNILAAHPKGTFAGIIPVDFAGCPVDTEELRAIADEHDLWIIEDACHAPGAWYTDSKGEKRFCGDGTYADLAIFSFHPVKHLTTGEGGIVTTNKPELYEKLQLLRSHGITKNSDRLEDNHGGWYYEMQELGYNYRIPDLNCALGISQLKRAEAGLERRRAIAEKYRKELAGLPINFLKNDQAAPGHAYHLFVIQTDKRKQLYDYLHEHGIYVQVHYIPLHTMPYYRNLLGKEVSLPVAEKYYSRCLSLPMFPTLTDEEQDTVIHYINTFFYATLSSYPDSELTSRKLITTA